MLGRVSLCIFSILRVKRRKAEVLLVHYNQVKFKGMALLHVFTVNEILKAQCVTFTRIYWRETEQKIHTYLTS